MKPNTYHVIIEPSGEYGFNKAPALIEVSKAESCSKLVISVISDQDNITKFIHKNLMSYLNKEDVLSYIRKDGNWRYYRVFSPKNINIQEFKKDPFNYEE